MEPLLRVLLWLLEVLAAQRTSLARLRAVLFRPQNEKSSHLFNQPAQNPKSPAFQEKRTRSQKGFCLYRGQTGVGLPSELATRTNLFQVREGPTLFAQRRRPLALDPGAPH